MYFKSVLSLLIGLLISLYSIGQQSEDIRCGTASLDMIQKSRDKDYKKFRETQNIEIKMDFENAKSGSLIQIPVVVHVLYRLDQQNISTEQVQSQIDVLNKDFNALNWDTMLVPQVWKKRIADSEIEFVLANRDPSGKVHSGITRTQTTIKDIGKLGGDEYYSTIKGGHDIWDRNSYLNFWVCEIQGLIYGFSALPGSPAESDGIVISWESFGNLGTANYPSDKGRTSTHEVGHWLNLAHIWGNATCGDDFVNDTPVQESENYGCQTFPKVSTLCGNGPDGDMFMNYMDYAQDKCMYLFTNGQKARMIACLINNRPSLANSLGYNGINTITRPAFKIRPNPADRELIISSGNTEGINKVQLFSITGRIVYDAIQEFQVQSHSIDLSKIIGGMYILSITTNSGTYSEKVFVRH